MQRDRVTEMSFVYVVLADNGDVKVGWSSTPFARLSKIKREYAGRRGFRQAQLVAFIQTERFVEVELVAHEILRPQAMEGEWFRVDPECAFEAVLLAASTIAPDRPVCVHRFDYAAQKATGGGNAYGQVVA